MQIQVILSPQEDAYIEGATHNIYKVYEEQIGLLEKNEALSKEAKAEMYKVWDRIKHENDTIRYMMNFAGRMRRLG